MFEDSKTVKNDTEAVIVVNAVLCIGDSCTTIWGGNGEMKVLKFDWNYDQPIHLKRLSDEETFWMKPSDIIAYEINNVLLFLDDYRMPIDCASYMYKKGVDCKIYHKEWNIVRSYWQFTKWIEENGLPEFISFDHDLADVVELKEELPIEQWFNFENNKEYTGMDCAKWLVNYCLDNDKPLPNYAVHSANPAGTENIEGLFKSFLKSGR